MFIRSLTLATLIAAPLLAAAGNALAADGDGPLAQERGHTRPLIVIARSSVDPTYLALKKSLEEPANRDAFKQRSMVLFTVLNTIGQRDGKELDPQNTMALIRELKLGASSGAKVILVGKDGEKKIEKDGPVDLGEIFATIDKMPMAEKEASAPPPAAPAATPAAGKPGKPANPAAAPKPLDD
jgi:hypothetical protein